MASNTYPMRQMEERHMATKVELMVWSQKMDLLAISNVKGEVALHRLSWQKVWSLSPPGEGVKATGIAWRSDGKVIAISYTNNEIHLINVENKDVVDKRTYTSNSDISDGEPLINFLCWLEERYGPRRWNNEASQNKANTYLPKLPPLSRSFGAITEEASDFFEDSKKTDDQHELNILVVGLADGRVDLLVFGLFGIGELTLPGGDADKIVAADASSDLSRLYILVLSENSTFKLYACNTSILADHAGEIHALGSKYGQVTSLLEYLENTMQAVMEACENMLLSEMESKLSQHADSMPRGSVSADLLELLMFGVASETLETFLLKGLTDKGLNKLSHSMEVCHSNIQKLILHHLRPVGQKIAFLLSDLRAMSRLVERYHVVGLDEETVANSYRENGSFLVKAYEVVSVTDTSLKKYRALFKWLYDVIMRLMDDAAGLPGVSHQDIAFIADYLYNLEGNGDDENEEGAVLLDSLPSKKKKFCYLDVLSQYIADAELSHPVPPENNPWEKFLADNPSIANHPNIIPRYPELSLVQQHKRLKSAINSVFEQPKRKIGAKITLDDVVQLVQTSMVNPRVSMRFIVYPSQIVIATILHPNTAYFTFFTIDVGQAPSTSKYKTNVYFKSMDTNVGFTTVDLQLFNDVALSVLLAEPADGSAVFAQLQLDRIEEAGRSKAITSQMNPVEQDGELYVDGCLLLDSRMKNLDNMRASRLAVSGGRKVAVILSENTHKVRTYEMEVDEEDEEEEDTDANRSGEA